MAFNFKATLKKNSANKQLYIVIKKKDLTKVQKKTFDTLVQANKPIKFFLGDDSWS